jgi:HSP20 family protein
MPNKKSFFERLAGTITVEDDDQIIDIENDDYEEAPTSSRKVSSPRVVTQDRRTPVREEEAYEEEEEGELSVDVYQTQSEIIIEAMVAGVKPEDLHLSITRDMVTIKGRREANNTISDEDYFYKELYWGNFSRTILLPHEVVIEEAEAVEKHGLLIIRMPKVDKARQTKLKVKSI